MANFRQKKALCSDPFVVQVKKTMHGNVTNKENLTEVLRTIIGTLSNRRRRPHDGNRKRDISFETSLRMYNPL